MTDRAPFPEHDRPAGALSTGLWLLAITLAGVFFRVSSINTRSLWLDETTAIRQASWSIPEMLAWMANNVHPPLFHTLLHYWIRVVGRSEVEVRAFALVWGVVAIPLVFWAAKTMYDRRVGLISAVLLALSPFYIWYSQEARMYTMMLVFALITLTSLWKALNGDGRVWWVLYALSSAAGIMTQYFFGFLIIGQAIYMTRHVYRRNLPEAEQDLEASPSVLVHIYTVVRDSPPLRMWLIASAAAMIPLAWWLPQVIVNQELFRGAAGSFNYGGTAPRLGIYFNELILVPVEAVFGFHSESVMRNLVSMWPLLITLVFVSTGFAKRLTGSTSYLAAGGVGGAAIIVALGQWQPIILELRYFTAVSVPILILTARFLSILKPRTFTLIATVLVLVGIGSWADQSFNPNSVVKWDNRQAMSVVSEGFQEGDTILLIPNFVSSIPEYYLTASQYSSLRKVPSFDARGVPRNTPVQLAQDLERQVGPSHRVWLIATWQETPRIAQDRALTVQWLRSQGFRVAQDHPLQKIRVTLYETEPGREFFIDQGVTP